VATATRTARDAASILKGISWEVYQALLAAPSNDHTRMTDHDGTLILMSPLYRHEPSADRIGLIIRNGIGVVRRPHGRGT